MPAMDRLLDIEKIAPQRRKARRFADFADKLLQ